MKCFACLFSFIIISSSLFSQEKCDDIHKLYDNQYYLVRNNQGKNVYCIHYLDTIKGINIANNLYEFCISYDSSVVVYLSRQWNVFKPLWNTFFTTDTISLLPIGNIRYVYNDDTIQFERFRSAYVGPRYISLRKKKKQNRNQIH